MNRGLRRAAVLLVLVGAGVLVVGAQAASAQVIEICKSSANGMSGRTFSYTVAPSGGSSFSVSVNGGRCSGPITVAGSTAVITEAQSDPATDVKLVTVRPSIRKLSENLPGRSVTVTTGASTASETLVTFVNQPAGGNFGSLKVCKLTETPAFIGRSFSFSVNGGPIVSTEANDAFAETQDLTCRLLGTFQQGSVVHVHEQIPAGVEVQFIDTDPGENLLDFNTITGDATIQITAGMTVVYYDNEPAPPAGTGFLEVCKDRARLGYGGEIDWDVSGPFNFTVTDAAGATYELTVLAGQCSEPIQVAAGVNEVVEHARAGFDLVDVWTLPDDRLLTTNLINRTATVEVPVSDSPNDETQVHFVNQAQRGQLKVCKALGPGSADLIGQRFHFDVDAPEDNDIWEGDITAAAQTQCRIVGFIPLGTEAIVEEEFADNDNPAENGAFIDRSCPGGYIDEEGDLQCPIIIQPGVNTVTITNTAKGLLEVCKAPVRFGSAMDAQAAVAPKQPYFTFRIDGGTPFSIQAGKCAPPKRVSVGNHTVTESAANDYELDPDAPGYGITVFPADREVSKNLATRTVTVSVPYGPNGETLVTFYNRIKLARLKICKVIPMTSEDALGGKPFTYTVNGSPFGAAILPGECTFYSRDVPILDAAGNPRVITVHEVGTPSTTWDVTSITVTGNRTPPAPVVDKANGNITFTVGPGINVVTYTNTAKDP